MSTQPSTPSPLAGDPARQADHLNRGITFQIWKSVEAWINLREGQVLFLEAAEDFDVVGQGTAIAVQTKATAASITLRSDSVISSLVNFWRTRTGNPSMKVFFRLVTTSPPAIEEHSPFTSEGGGLEAWKLCGLRGDLSLADRLRTFLCADGSISRRLGDEAGLLAFLKSTSPEVFLNELIRCVSFETDSSDSDVVSQSIKTSLHAFGERMRLRPNECDGALDRLFRVAAETAGKREHRMLNRERFRTEFEDAVLKKFSPSEIAAIQQGRPIQSAQPVAAMLGQAFHSALVIQSGVPEVPSPTLRRTKLVQDIAAQIGSVGIVVLGSTSGFGKSTVAKLCANSLGGDWLWADFQGLPPGNIPIVVRALAAALASTPNATHIALDNLDYQPAELAGVENALAAIARMVRLRGGKVILTTQREFPQRLRQKLGLAATDVVKVPRFHDDEIRDFCMLLQCPDTNLAARHAKIVGVQTSGHPRLVHARLAGLSAAGWPAIIASDVLEIAPEIIEELDLARQLLEAAGADAKIILYRLSLLMGEFRRDHAIAVGSVSPAMSFPADVFDRLVGPWIDRLARGYYRLSPLLKQSAESNWSAEKIRELRGLVGSAIGKCGRLTLLEANEILFQGLLAEDEQLLTNIVVPLTGSRGNEVEALAEAMPWLPLIGRSPGTMAFKKNVYLNFLLRILQFRILMIQTPDEVDPLCDTVDLECAGLQDDLRPSSRFMWLTFAMIYYQARLKPKRLLAYWVEAQELAAKDPELRKLAENTEEKSSHLPDTPDADYAGHWLFMIVAREMTSSGLLAFVDAINNLPEQYRFAAIEYLKKMPFPARLTVERAWFREADKPNADCNRILSNLAVFRERIQGWNFPALGAFAARGAAQVEDEFRNNPIGALAILDEALQTATSHNYLLLDQRAVVLFRQKKFAEALALWEPILPSWPVEGKTADHTALYASQRAAHAAGALGKWPQVLLILRRGRDLAKTAGDQLAVITFRADEGHALWHNGDRLGALRILAEALRDLEQLKPRDHLIVQIHRARKCLEQVIKRFRFLAGAAGAEEEWEPPAGFCSGIELGEKLKDFEACPYDLLWYFIADTEFSLGGGDELLSTARTRRGTSQFAVFRGLISELGIRHAFRSHDFRHLVEDLAGTSQALIDSTAQAATGKRVVDTDAFGNRTVQDPAPAVADGIVAALIVLGMAGKPIGGFISDWKSATQKLPQHEQTLRRVGAVERVLAAGHSDLPEIFRNDDERVACSVAAVRMSIEPNISLEGMFAGHASLTRWLQTCPIRSDCEQIWGELVRTRWALRTSFPAQFSTPRLVIPPIKEACADSSTGSKLAARILLAARDAVLIRVPESVVAEWRNLAC